MNPHRIYTRKTLGLDNRVWRLMIAMIIIPFGLLSYGLIDKEECAPFYFNVKTLDAHDDVLYPGVTLSFTSSKLSKDITWDFGDNTEGMGAVVHHKFLKEGIYLVTANSNKLCEFEKQITIKNPPVVVQPSDVAEANIIGPGSFYTSTEQRFTFPGTAAYYEWTVLNNTSPGPRSGQSITYTFYRAGKYTIQVELDHDRRKRYNHDIIVEDKVRPTSRIKKKVRPLIRNLPPQPVKDDPQPSPTVAVEQPKNKFKVISDQIFTGYLNEVINDKKKVQDFDTYLCEGASTPVIANGKRQTFIWLCNDLSKDKKTVGVIRNRIKIKSLKVNRKDECVISIEIKYR